MQLPHYNRIKFFLSLNGETSQKATKTSTSCMLDANNLARSYVLDIRLKRCKLLQKLP